MKNVHAFYRKEKNKIQIICCKGIILLAIFVAVYDVLAASEVIVDSEDLPGIGIMSSNDAAFDNPVLSLRRPIFRAKSLFFNDEYVKQNRKDILANMSRTRLDISIADFTGTASHVWKNIVVDLLVVFNRDVWSVGVNNHFINSADVYSGANVFEKYGFMPVYVSGHNVIFLVSIGHDRLINLYDKGFVVLDSSVYGNKSGDVLIDINTGNAMVTMSAGKLFDVEKFQIINQRHTLHDTSTVVSMNVLSDADGNKTSSGQYVAKTLPSIKESGRLTASDSLDDSRATIRNILNFYHKVKKATSSDQIKGRGDILRDLNF